MTGSRAVAIPLAGRTTSICSAVRTGGCTARGWRRRSGGALQPSSINRWSDSLVHPDGKVTVATTIPRYGLGLVATSPGWTLRQPPSGSVVLEPVVESPMQPETPLAPLAIPGNLCGRT